MNELMNQQRGGEMSDRLSERSVLLPTSMMSTSEPRSVLTSSIHLDVCWNEFASAVHSRHIIVVNFSTTEWLCEITKYIDIFLFSTHHSIVFWSRSILSTLEPAQTSCANQQLIELSMFNLSNLLTQPVAHTEYIAGTILIIIIIMSR